MAFDLRSSKSYRIRDDRAYILPMGIFLAVLWIGTLGPESPGGKTLYPWAYAVRALLVGLLLVAFRRSFTPIRWNHWWLGLIVGVAGIFQWIPMQLWLQSHFEWFRPSSDAFNPAQFFAGSPAAFYGFIAVRLFGAVVTVPFMEELFWRDFVWRTIAAPNDFKRAGVGGWNLVSFVIVTLLFATAHGNWFLTALVWGAMVGGLLIYTRSLGACIIAHATTNLALGIYVMYTQRWDFW